MYLFLKNLQEIFRGKEMVNQFRYIKNRTPFLDIEFLKAVFQNRTGRDTFGFL
jgi:hypothetical protein